MNLQLQRALGWVTKSAPVCHLHLKAGGQRVATKDLRWRAGLKVFAGNCKYNLQQTLMAAAEAAGWLVDVEAEAAYKLVEGCTWRGALRLAGRGCRWRFGLQVDGRD